MGRLILADGYGENTMRLSAESQMRLAEGYVGLDTPDGKKLYMRRDCFLSEISTESKQRQYELMKDYWPGYLGMAIPPEAIATVISVAGQVVTFIKGVGGDKNLSPTQILPPATVILAPGVSFSKAMIEQGNGVYYQGKVFLTEQGYNKLNSQTWPDEATKQAYMNAFPFTVPDSWKATLAPYELKGSTPPTSTTTPNYNTTLPAGTTSPASRPSSGSSSSAPVPATKDLIFNLPDLPSSKPFYKRAEFWIPTGIAVTTVIIALAMRKRKAA